MTELYASAKIASDIITPIFKTAAVFLKAHNFPQAILWENCLLLGTDNVLRQISNYIFAPKVGFCLFVILVVNHDQLSFRFNYSIVCLSVTRKLCSNSVCNFFAAVHQLNGPLGKQMLTVTVQKVTFVGWDWFNCNPFCLFLIFKVSHLLSCGND